MHANIMTTTTTAWQLLKYAGGRRKTATSQASRERESEKSEKENCEKQIKQQQQQQQRQQRQGAKLGAHM